MEHHMTSTEHGMTRTRLLHPITVAYSGLLVALLIGCAPSKTPDYGTIPCTQEGVEGLAISDFSSVSVSFDENKFVNLDQPNHHLVRPLIEALVPFQVQATEKNRPLRASCDCIIHVHAGSEPVDIYVWKNSQGLRFEIGNFVYFGGDCKVFSHQIEKIKATGNVNEGIVIY